MGQLVSYYFKGKFSLFGTFEVYEITTKRKQNNRKFKDYNLYKIVGIDHTRYPIAYNLSNILE